MPSAWWRLVSGVRKRRRKWFDNCPFRILTVRVNHYRRLTVSVRMTDGGPQPLAHSTRELGVTNDAVPLFTDSPPQVGFSPDGDAADAAAQEAVEAPGAGPIDLAATADGTLLYVQNTLAGTIEGFAVAADGSLTLVETLDEGLPTFADGSGMEGLVVI